MNMGRKKLIGLLIFCFSFMLVFLITLEVNRSKPLEKQSNDKSIPTGNIIENLSQLKPNEAVVENLQTNTFFSPHIYPP
jgi:hypothetical protein